MENFIDEEKTFSQYLSDVFAKVGIGVGVTAVISFLISENMNFLLERFALGFTGLMFGAIIAEFVIAIFFGLRLQKMSKKTAWVCYKLVAKTHRLAYGMKATYIFYLSFT